MLKKVRGMPYFHPERSEAGGLGGTPMKKKPGGNAQESSFVVLRMTGFAGARLYLSVPLHRLAPSQVDASAADATMTPTRLGPHSSVCIYTSVAALPRKFSSAIFCKSNERNQVDVCGDLPARFRLPEEQIEKLSNRSLHNRPRERSSGRMGKVMLSTDMAKTTCARVVDNWCVNWKFRMAPPLDLLDPDSESRSWQPDGAVSTLDVWSRKLQHGPVC